LIIIVSIVIYYVVGVFQGIHITPESVQGIRDMIKKEYGVEYSDQEVWEATHNLLGAFEWLLEQDRKQHPENYKKLDIENTEQK